MKKRNVYFIFFKLKTTTKYKLMSSVYCDHDDLIKIIDDRKKLNPGMDFEYRLITK